MQRKFGLFKKVTWSMINYQRKPYFSLFRQLCTSIYIKKLYCFITKMLILIKVYTYMIYIQGTLHFILQKNLSRFWRYLDAALAAKLGGRRRPQKTAFSLLLSRSPSQSNISSAAPTISKQCFEPLEYNPKERSKFWYIEIWKVGNLLF